MKNIKHYFSSPKEHADEQVCIIVNETNGSEVSDVSLKTSVDVLDSSSKDKSKKKRRKRKFNEEIDSSLLDSPVASPAVEPVVEKKKRKKSDVLKVKNTITVSPLSNGDAVTPDNSSVEVHKLEKRRRTSVSRKSRDSSSSKENSGSDVEEKECSTPETSKSLLNYFTKVDKLPEIPEKPRIMKVEVLIHADSSGSPPSCNGSSSIKIVKKKRSKKVVDIDFDLITTEELPLEQAAPVNSVPPILPKLGEESKKADDSIHLISNDGGNDNKAGHENMPRKSQSGRSSTVNVSSSKGSTSAKDIEVKNGIRKDLAEESDDVIFVKSEFSKEKSKMKHDGTLASFFNLGNKGPPIPYERKIAKQLFLNSSAPPSIKKITTNTICQGNIAPFPTKSHIQQKERMNILWNLNPIKFDFTSVESAVKHPPWSWILDKMPTVNDIKPKEEKSFDSKASLKDLKKELNLFPIGCWHKELKKMRKGSDHTLWTERYRPHNSSAFLANTRSIAKLKAWLTELKESSNSDSGGSSGDEFLKENEETKSERKTLALLSGPPGTGKTAAIYAVAEEIGYNVLEINASSNRSGKRILNEFSEAMKSHKVGISKLNFSKVKKKPEDPKRNLILIEDADLLFDDDEGFVPTLMNLGAGTKRPIVLVANNPQAKHFAKLAPLFHSTLEFVPPTHDRLGSWLRTVSSVEGFHLGQEESEILASTLDLRKSLLQLQLTQSYQQAKLNKDEEERTAWLRAGDFDLSSKKGRKKAKRVLSTLTSIDLIRHSQISREVVPYWYKAPEDSTLTLECSTVPSYNLDDIRASLLGLVSSKLPSSASGHYFEIPRNLVDMEKDTCSMTGLLNRRGMALDVWPTLRQISRTEAVRLASHTKRNNRYFNYLSSLGMKGPPDAMQALSSAFS